jgi:hypothetical protein
LVARRTRIEAIEKPRPVRLARIDREQQTVVFAIFRLDTFGDEQEWTTVLRMHEAFSVASAASTTRAGHPVGDREARIQIDNGKAGIK